MKIAVLIPCYNEEFTIGKVIDDFHRELPGAEIYMFDNNSLDKTLEVAEKHGAICRVERKRGKGNVVRRMFNNVAADVYLIVDGDDTYDAKYAKDLVEAVKNGADMAIGQRVNYTNSNGVRKFGNQFINYYIKSLFRLKESLDVLSGYRAFSKDFVKTIELDSEGFDIETEMTLKALKLNKKIVSVPVSYRDRPAGSESKLSTFADGVLIMARISQIYWGQ